MATEDLEEVDTITIAGEERKLDDIKFVQLQGTELTIYLPENLQHYKNPQGEEVVVNKGGEKVQFRDGIYPPGDQTIDKDEAEMLADHPHYGELFTLAAEEQDTPTAEEVRESIEESMEENEVMVDGEIMTKAEALEYLKSQDGEEDENVPSEFDREAEDKFDGEVHQGQLKDLDASNRQEALELLASEGVPMENAPPASATTSKIQEFAVDHGYNIPKYDLPENEE